MHSRNKFSAAEKKISSSWKNKFALHEKKQIRAAGKINSCCAKKCFMQHLSMMDATSPHRVPTDILGFDCRAIFADERILLSHISAILAKKGAGKLFGTFLAPREADSKSNSKN